MAVGERDGATVTATAGITAAEAARRLGVKRETLYAYVSRGLLLSRREPGGRRSLFDAAEVRRLAERRRVGGRAGALELVVDSELTLLDPAGHLWFRGWDAAVASRSATFEQVAEWLWKTDAPGSFVAAAPGLAGATKAQRDLPPDARPVERFRVALAAAALTDPLRFDLRPTAVAATGRRIIGTLVDASPLAAALPGAAAAPDTDDAAATDHPSDVTVRGLRSSEIAARLAPRLCAGAARWSPAQLRALQGALILLADHEMASSTLAARVAASTWADPYLVVLAGLSVLGGPLHGGAGDRLVPLVYDAARMGAAVAVGERLRAGEQLGGFGHPVYARCDPRADALWPLLEAGWPGDPMLEAVAGVVDVVRSQGESFPNIDMALAALVACAGMVPGSAEAIFAVARCAGWLGHAMEEYRHRLRFRVRAAYTGQPPGDGPDT